MPVTHEPWLVALSLLVAIQGAYVGLSLAVQIGTAVGVRRRWLLAAASLSLAVAIWSMHFVAMLAARLPFPIDYLVLPTLLSFLVCVLVVGAAVFAVSAGPLTATRLTASAVFMGLGIVSMHYIGMAALHDSAHMAHDPLMVGASVAIAIGASGLALRLAAASDHRPPLILSATALGLAIAGMHYTAMAGMTIFAHPNPNSPAPALSVDLLAIVVAVVAFIVSSLFLLVLVPDADAAGKRSVGLPATPVPGNTESAGDPEAADPVRDEPAAALLSTALPSVLPVEKDGTTHLLSVDNVVAVRANAHYTYVFDGTATYFCQLAIGDVESRLDPERFARVHRSHIINLERVLRLKRAGDNGLIELKAHDSYVVPVSRGRLALVKSQLGPRTHEAIP